MSTQPMPHDPHRFSRATLQPLAKELGLVRARVHEFCGPARRSLAAVLMGQTTGPVLWIFAGWQAERLFPDGLHGFTDPGRVLFAQARRTEDMLWTMEEALRSGAIALIFADLVDIPAMTPVRRLHLAAEQGALVAGQAGRLAPLGIILTPHIGGAAGIESRWHIRPTPSQDPHLAHTYPEPRWQLERLRARLAPPAQWILKKSGATTAL
ncbi:MAG: hypothetical protein NWQ64_01515 [Paracoccaceae bacterium]|jgi:protein ImuA|nr:MAG: hypothetical protein ABR89_02690 [Rhodobacter sp. BACL10 MAG-120910-bin24]MDP5356801.1 hypothetical protein [Paracoccaceae bacterium]HCB54182.1 hypothetical protein [Rhodobacter sp.]